jgi:TolB-like protein/DNA-binding winged helix-turn-helix (wHTH) protein
MPHAPSKRSLCFDDFEVDLLAHELKRAGRRVHLQEKSYQLLAALLERPGEALSRDELRRRLWPADTYLEFDDSLNHIVRRLREALGDTSPEPRYIETIPRHGYRFMGSMAASVPGGAGAAEPVRLPKVEPAPVAALTDSPAPARERAPGDDSPARARFRWDGRAAVAALTIVVVAGVLLLLNRKSPTSSAHTAAAGIRNVAVLPFENLSKDDPEAELIAQGLTDALITDLARLRSVRVTSRTTVMAQPAGRRDARSIGRVLQVDAIVEGTLLKAGDRLRLTAQLIDTRTDEHVWAQRYERRITEALNLEDELASAIAAPLNAAFLRSPADGWPPRQLDAAAYLAYQRGRALKEQPTPMALRNAIGEFRRSIAIQPDYGPAHAWLARTYARAAHDHLFSPAEAFAEVERAATGALAIEPALPEAVIALAVKRFLYDWDWVGARRLFDMAIPLSASDPEALVWYADFLAAVGQIDDAVRQAEEMRRLDPVSPGPAPIVAYYNYLAGRHVVAIDQARAVLAKQPDSAFAHLVYGLAALGALDAKTGREHFDEFFRLAPQARPYVGLIGHARALEGNRDGALAALRELEQLSQTSYASPVQFAIVHVALGDHDTAFAWLERAYLARDHDLAFIKVWAMLEPLRDDPRFASLVRRMGLPVSAP